MRGDLRLRALLLLVRWIDLLPLYCILRACLHGSRAAAEIPADALTSATRKHIVQALVFGLVQVELNVEPSRSGSTAARWEPALHRGRTLQCFFFHVGHGALRKLRQARRELQQAGRNSCLHPSGPLLPSGEGGGALGLRLSQHEFPAGLPGQSPTGPLKSCGGVHVVLDFVNLSPHLAPLDV